MSCACAVPAVSRGVSVVDAGRVRVLLSYPLVEGSSDRPAPNRRVLFAFAHDGQVAAGSLYDPLDGWFYQRELARLRECPSGGSYGRRRRKPNFVVGQLNLRES